MTIKIDKPACKAPNSKQQNGKTKFKSMPSPISEIIDFEMIKKFNIYYRFLHSFESLETFREMKKRSENELEKSTN